MLRTNCYNALFRKSGSLIWNYQGIQGISFHELTGNSRVVVSKSLFWQILPPISLDFVFFLREFDLKKNSAFMDLEKFHTPKPWCYSPYFWGWNKWGRGGRRGRFLIVWGSSKVSENPGNWKQEFCECTQNGSNSLKNMVCYLSLILETQQVINKFNKTFCDKTKQQ